MFKNTNQNGSSECAHWAILSPPLTSLLWPCIRTAVHPEPNSRDARLLAESHFREALCLR
jgi:hypothetical protein